MAEKPILVTGGAGYIGSHACKALKEAGYTPVVYDNLSTGHRWAVRWGPLEQGDLNDRGRLIEVIRQYEPKTIMHFSAYSDVGESVKHPGKYYHNNFIGAYNLLEAMLQCKIRNLVFSSTAAVYGTPVEQPIREDFEYKPINPYGASKLMVETMIRDYHHAYDINAVILRYFNAAGADEDGQIGEDHDPETHLIPLILDAASGRRDSIAIFGTDYLTADGTCVRDYVHVTDLANAHVAAIDQLHSSRSYCDAFNLGYGVGASVKEVIDVAKRVTGIEIPVDMGDRREGDPERLVADPTKALKELNWKPRYDDLDAIIRTAWSWHQKKPAYSARD